MSSSLHPWAHALVCKAFSPRSWESVHAGSCGGSRCIRQPRALCAVNLAFRKLPAVWCLEGSVILAHKFQILVVLLHWADTVRSSPLQESFVVVVCETQANLTCPKAACRKPVKHHCSSVTCDHFQVPCRTGPSVAFPTPNKVSLLTLSFPLGTVPSSEILLRGYGPSKETLRLYSSFDTNEPGRFNCQIKVECINPHNRSNEVRVKLWSLGHN